MTFSEQTSEVETLGTFVGVGRHGTDVGTIVVSAVTCPTMSSLTAALGEATSSSVLVTLVPAAPDVCCASGDADVCAADARSQREPAAVRSVNLDKLGLEASLDCKQISMSWVTSLCSSRSTADHDVSH